MKLLWIMARQLLFTFLWLCLLCAPTMKVDFKDGVKVRLTGWLDLWLRRKGW